TRWLSAAPGRPDFARERADRVTGGKSVILLGDPQQLDQPLKGSHPDGVAVSALQHVLGDHETIPAERAIFLEETWRLHPSVCPSRLSLSTKAACARARAAGSRASAARRPSTRRASGMSRS